MACVPTPSHRRVALGLAALLGTFAPTGSGCSPLGSAVPSYRPAFVLAPVAPAGFVVATAGFGGGSAMTVTVGPPYGLQAVVASWAAADVYEYRLSLRKRVGDAAVPLNPPVTLVLPLKGATRYVGARFQDLAAEVYEVGLEAWGNAGGTAAVQRLDDPRAGGQVVDFRGLVEEREVALTPVLATRAFAATVSVAIEPPVTGAGRFAAADVFEYRLAVTRKQGSAYVALTPAVGLVVPAKGSARGVGALVRNLAAGGIYRVSLVAHGNVGGTAATTILNQAVPTSREIDLTGNAPDDLHALALNVTLDAK